MANDSLFEMVMHPWATLRRIQGLDRLPDRRVSRTPTQRSQDTTDPLRTHGFAKSLYKALGVFALDTTRIELYENYEEMDTDPIIAAVADAFGDDATQIDPEHKRAVWVEASNNDVAKIVTETMDRLGIEDKAFPICRSLALMGDHMEHLALARGQGIVAMRAYEPHAVARIEDDIGRLIGFAPSNDRGEPQRKESSSVGPYKVAHFRLPPRRRNEIYGAASSFFWGSRVVHRQLQLMEDQVVIQRLMRRPDRLLTLLDATGLAYDEAWDVIKQWERRWYRESHLNPGTAEFRSQGLPVDGAQDMILPRGPNNQTSIQNFPATNQNDLLRDLDMWLGLLAAGIGFPLGFIGRPGQGGQYRPDQSLSRQYQPFAKKAARLQRAFLTELVRVIQIDLAFKGLNVSSPDNQFALNMSSVAPIVEIERAEVVQLKMDRMDRALRLGSDAQLNMSAWIPFVLEKYGGLPKSVVNQIYQSSSESGDRMESVTKSDRIECGALYESSKGMGIAFGELIPEVSTSLGVSSSQVHIDNVGDERTHRDYVPKVAMVLNEGRVGEPHKSLTEAKASAAPLAGTLDGAAARRRKGIRSDRAKTKVALVSALAGIPPTGG